MRNLGGCRGPWGVSMGEGAESSHFPGNRSKQSSTAPDFETCSTHIYQLNHSRARKIASPTSRGLCVFPVGLPNCITALPDGLPSPRVLKNS